MLKPKKVAIPAVLGFIFSFLISLIATHRFGIALLRGIIFGIVFALLIIGISLLYDKFLDDGTGDAGDSGVKIPSHDKTGSVVDITIADEKLNEDEQGPQFFVGNNKHSLDSSDMVDLKESRAKNEQDISDVGNGMDKIPTAGSLGAADHAAAAEQNRAAAFQPVDLGKGNGAPAGSSDEDDLDSLPDIGDFVPEKKDDEGTEQDKDIIKDSDFAVEGENQHLHTAEFPDGSNAKNHDAETMAKAIRT